MIKMDSGIKRQLGYLLSLEEKLLLHRIIRSNLVATSMIELIQLTKKVKKNKKRIVHEILILIHNGVTITMFDPCFYNIDPTKSAEEMLLTPLNPSRYYVTMPMMIRDDGVDRRVIRLTDRAVWKRVNNTSFNWYMQEGDRYLQSSIEHYIRLEDVTAHLQESSRHISSTIDHSTGGSNYVSFYLDSRHCNATPIHNPLLKKAIDIILEYRGL